MEAGQQAKNAGLVSMAFVCWNKLLDLNEAIEEGDTSMLENADFQNTDVPFDVPLPTKPIEKVKLEQIRDWVLQTSLDQKVTQEVDKRDCDRCGTNIYEASLVCHNCNNNSEACIVTGYPVLRNKVKCTSCSKWANQDDWNKFIMSERVKIFLI
jgi:intraflagellar transport protein 172